MSKQEIFKALNNSTLRLIVIFFFAAIAGVVLILSLAKFLL